MTVYELKWGILGAGNISGQFVHDLVLNNSLKTDYQHVIVSIGSSSEERGLEFIKSHNVHSENNYGTEPVVEDYEAFYKNPEVQAVYIGTPHSFHKEQVTKALNNGKHVLCEKPFTINNRDAQELIDLANEKGLYLLEAVWTRFMPMMIKLKQMLLEEKVLGDLKRLMCDFTFDAAIETLPPSSRVRDNKLGGGALLDIGVYCITYARLLLDPKLAPENDGFQVKSFQVIDPVDNVDYSSSFLIQYASGPQAVLTCSNHGTNPPHVPFLKVQGTKGYLEIFGANAARPEKAAIYLKGSEAQPIVLHEDDTYNGFIYEANAVAEDIASHKLQNESVQPLAETSLVMATMDRIRSENSFYYQEDQL